MLVYDRIRARASRSASPTDLLIGDLFHNGVDKVWGSLESLYEPGKAPIPTWDAGTRADQTSDKSNMLVLPEGRTR